MDAETDLEIGSIGARVDLNVRVGDTLGPFEATLTDDDGAVLDLTDCTFEAAVSRIDDPEDGLLPITVTNAAPLTGVITFAMDDTSDLAGDSDDFFQAEATYAWFLRKIDANGNKQTVFFGYVKVAKEDPI